MSSMRWSFEPGDTAWAEEGGKGTIYRSGLAER